MEKYRNILVWPIMVIALILFWISLRSPVNQFEYALAALIVWGLAYWINKRLKQDKE